MPARCFAFAVLLVLSLPACAATVGIRHVALAGAPRAIYLPLADELHLAFDTEQLRTLWVWAGDGLELNGTPHTGNKTPFLSRARNAPFMATLPFAGWGFGTNPPAKIKSRPEELQFTALNTAANVARLEYRVGDGPNAVAITETPLALEGVPQGFGRRLEIAATDQPLWFQALTIAGDLSVQRRIDRSAVAVQTTNGWLVLALIGTADGVALHSALETADLSHEVENENGSESVRLRVTPSGSLFRAHVAIPPHHGPLTLGVVTMLIAEFPADTDAFVRRLANALEESLPDPGAEAAPPKPLTAAQSESRPRGDAHYQIESFTLPPEVDLKVTGMAWDHDGNLAVCTWPGDIWVVEGARGDPARARYLRYATGLDEPLGVVQVDGALVVAQKPALTRVLDRNGDGRADRYECLNDDWAYTGNYHAFTFGPALEPDGSYVLGFCGQRARWDVDFASWLVRIGADGRELSPIAGGLRAPNGIGFFGPDNDLFATDNQGNWIGACKLNHIQPGQTYGYRAARPAPPAAWEHPSADFAPPAVWFPRKLAPSAAGFVTVPTQGFGPFGGQMLVADFQNAVVLRVALEQVNGQWQGAVFPFLKGFGSGANRLIFDPEGRLYVGGVKNKAWSSLGPFEGSLDRVRFTGRQPFEIQSVHAMKDGLELVFTGTVNPEYAGDPESYFVSQFNYAHHETYGSPELDHEGTPGSATTIEVVAARVSDDRLSVRLQLAGWRTGYVTRVVAPDLESATGDLLRTEEFYYTLNQLPQ